MHTFRRLMVFLLAVAAAAGCSVIAGKEDPVGVSSQARLRIDYRETLRNEESLRSAGLREIDFSSPSSVSLQRPVSVDPTGGCLRVEKAAAPGPLAALDLDDVRRGAHEAAPDRVPRGLPRPDRKEVPGVDDAVDHQAPVFQVQGRPATATAVAAAHTRCRGNGCHGNPVPKKVIRTGRTDATHHYTAYRPGGKQHFVFQPAFGMLPN